MYGVLQPSQTVILRHSCKRSRSALQFAAFYGAAAGTKAFLKVDTALDVQNLSPVGYRKAQERDVKGCRRCAAFASGVVTGVTT